MNESAKDIAEGLRRKAKREPAMAHQVNFGQWSFIYSMWACPSGGEHHVASAKWFGKGKPGHGDERKLRKVLDALGAPQASSAKPGDDLLRGVGSVRAQEAVDLAIALNQPNTPEMITDLIKHANDGPSLITTATYWRWKHDASCTENGPGMFGVVAPVGQA